MKTCLTEDRLVALHYGDGDQEERAHEQSCLACRRRYRELERQLARIGEVLSDPPPTAHTPQHATWPRGVVPATALVAFAALLVWIVADVSGPARVGDPRAARVASTYSGADLAELSGAAFEDPDFDTTRLTIDSVELAYLQAALDDEFPCFWSDPYYADGCEYDLVGSSLGG